MEKQALKCLAIAMPCHARDKGAIIQVSFRAR